MGKMKNVPFLVISLIFGATSSVSVAIICLMQVYQPKDYWLLNQETIFLYNFVFLIAALAFSVVGFNLLSFIYSIFVGYAKKYDEDENKED